jgi:hypothetical protein
MELKDLVGLRLLTAVDRGEIEPDANDTWNEKSVTMTFVLDGAAYTVIEDTSDGYRSSMRELKVTPGYVPTSVFQPVQVFGVYVDKGNGDAPRRTLSAFMMRRPEKLFSH